MDRGTPTRITFTSWRTAAGFYCDSNPDRGALYNAPTLTRPAQLSSEDYLTFLHSG